MIEGKRERDDRESVKIVYEEAVKRDIRRRAKRMAKSSVVRTLAA